MGRTLYSLRHDVADACHDLATGLATAAGTLTTLVDAARWEPDDHWVGAELYIYSGLGLGQTRRVTNWTRSTQTFEPTPAFTTAADLTTAYELHRRFSVRQYNRAINRAIESVRELSLVDMSSTALTTSDDVYEYALPSDFMYVTKVGYRDTDGTPTPDWTYLSHWDGEWELRPGRYLWVDWPTAGYTLSVHGQRLPILLTTDTSVNEVPDDYVVWYATMVLLQSAITGAANDVENAGQVAAFANSLAQPQLPRRGPKPGARRVI
jgi:hypothetical protein